MKRIVSLLLSGVLILMSLACPSVAYEGASAGDVQEMQAALAEVKMKIDVPSEFKNFTYQYLSENDNGKWNFNWETDDGSGLRVRSDSEGRIINYSRFENKESGNGAVGRAPRFTKEQAQTKIMAFLKKTVPEIYESLDKNPRFYSSAYDNVYSFTFDRRENDIICRDQWINISIDYISGTVEHMSTAWLYDVEFKKVSQPISPKDARKIWKENVELELRYLYEYSESGTKAYLAYIPVSAVKEINADTGEIIEQKYEWVNGKNDAVMEDSVEAGMTSGGGAANKDRFTEEEINKLTEHSELLTLEQADKKVRSIPNLSIDGSYAVASGSLATNRSITPARDSDDMDYIWRIVYTEPVTKGESPKSVYANVDAKTGQLISYNDYSENWLNIGKKAKINQKQADEIVNGFVNAAVGEKAESVLLPDISENILMNDSGKNVHIGWEYAYKRKHDEITVANDGFYVSVNRMTGKITSYHSNWTECAEFESSQGAMDKNAATEAFIGNATVKLEYHIFTTYFYDKEKKDISEKATVDSYFAPPVKNDKSTILVYRLESPSGEISAKTGEYINVPENNSQETVRYSDIKGHWAEREIELLANIGVLPKAKEFNPGKTISQEAFLTGLFLSKGRAFSYESAVSQGLITKEEIRPTDAVSRYKAIDFIVKYLGYGKLAGDYSIFKVTFSDAAQIPKEYIGSVAIGKSIGIVSGSNGKFNGSSYLTNADAAMMIYNTMQKAIGY